MSLRPLCKRLAISIISIVLLTGSVAHAKSAKRSVGEVLDDNVISVKLKTRYMKDKVVNNTNIKIKVRRGVVQLSGVVNSQDEINRAIELAEKQRGVKEVKAYLVLKDVGELVPVSDNLDSGSDSPSDGYVAAQKPAKKTAKKSAGHKKTNSLNETDLHELTEPDSAAVNQGGKTPEGIKVSDTMLSD